MAADTSYQPNIYRRHGGNRMDVRSEETTNRGILDISGGNDVILMTNAGVPTNGSSGTGAGDAGPGSLCIDRTYAVVYCNSGTKASPIWRRFGSSGS